MTNRFCAQCKELRMIHKLCRSPPHFNLYFAWFLSQRQNVRSNERHKYKHVCKRSGPGSIAEMCSWFAFPFYQTPNHYVWRNPTHHILILVEAIFPCHNCSNWEWVFNSVWYPCSAACFPNNKDFIALLEIKQGPSGIHKVRSIAATFYPSCQRNVGFNRSSNSRCSTPNNATWTARSGKPYCLPYVRLKGIHSTQCCDSLVLKIIMENPSITSAVTQGTSARRHLRSGWL